MGTRDLSASTAELDAVGAGSSAPSAPVPGVIQIFAEPRPMMRSWRLERGPVELGRSELAVEASGDAAISRRHVRLSHDGQAFIVEDLESRNGTYANGQLLSGRLPLPAHGVIRAGGTVLLTVRDVTEFEEHGVGVQDGVVSGPALRRLFAEVASTTSVSATLMIRGESGSGKELAARAFHTASGAGGPFSAINCATIPKDLAERELFGARRGAFSGANDVTGYVQAAHRGTLFLDEIAELPLDVQSKLLRVVETRQVFRLGSSQPEHIEFKLCAASWRNLREEVRTGRFREDLYFRIGQPEVQLPALRDRPEEIPWHVVLTVEECAQTSGTVLRASAGFIEACLLRAWPGNVREVRAEVRRCAASVVGRRTNSISAEDLGESAGTSLDPLPSSSVSALERGELLPPVKALPRDDVSNALIVENGNVLAAARRLGVNRGKVRNWLAQHRLDSKAFKASKR